MSQKSRSKTDDKKENKPIRTLAGVVLSVCVFVLLTSVTQPSCLQSPSGCEDWDKTARTSESFPGSCTTFAAAYGNKVFFGNNEDFSNPNTYLWAEPSDEGIYGGVYLGYSWGHPQGGINEKGLAFDALALPDAELNPQPELPSRGRSDTQFLGKIMRNCADVDEAIRFVKRFNWGSSVSFQVLLADATGDAVIISAGPDGELVFTRKPKGNSYLVGTNFNRANSENHFGSFPCWRYDKAETMLSQIETKADLSVDRFMSILDAVHVEGAEQNTLYSNIFDLRKKVIYLYFWHQFDEVVTLDVIEQINNGLPLTRLSDLFSQKTVKLAEDEHQLQIKRAARDEWLNQYGKAIIAGGGVFILGLFGIIVFLIVRRNKHVQNQ